MYCYFVIYQRFHLWRSFISNDFKLYHPTQRLLYCQPIQVLFRICGKILLLVFGPTPLLIQTLKILSDIQLKIKSLVYKIIEKNLIVSVYRIQNSIFGNTYRITFLWTKMVIGCVASSLAAKKDSKEKSKRQSSYYRVVRKKFFCGILNFDHIFILDAWETDQDLTE